MKGASQLEHDRAPCSATIDAYHFKPVHFFTDLGACPRNGQLYSLVSICCHVYRISNVCIQPLVLWLSLLWPHRRRQVTWCSAWNHPTQDHNMRTLYTTFVEDSQLIHQLCNTVKDEAVGRSNSWRLNATSPLRTREMQTAILREGYLC